MGINRNMSEDEIADTLKRAKVCRIAFISENGPYIIPLVYGYDGNHLYVHSSRRGKKIDILRKNSRVCFQIDTDVEIKESEIPCRWDVKYRSVIGWGNAVLIDDIEEKRGALNHIMRHYSGESTFEFSEEELDKVAVIKIEIDRITGKVRL